MYILGHVGVTLAAARAADAETDLRAAALLALGPDLLDKPFRWVFPALVNDNSRGFGHTLLAWLAVGLILAIWRPRLGRPVVLWSCFAGHAVLDRMWLGHDPKVFLWPLLGPFPAPVRSGPLFAAVFRYDLAGELVGLAALGFLAWTGRLRGWRGARPPAKLPS